MSLREKIWRVQQAASDKIIYLSTWPRRGTSCRGEEKKTRDFTRDFKLAELFYRACVGDYICGKREDGAHEKPLRHVTDDRHERHATVPSLPHKLRLCFLLSPSFDFELNQFYFRKFADIC